MQLPARTCALVAAIVLAVASARPIEVQAGDRRTYLIRFGEAGAMDYRGGIGALPASAPAGAARFDVSAAAVAAYRAFLHERQARHLEAIGVALGRVAEPIHDYTLVHSGVALQLTAAEAERVRMLPDIQAVEESRWLPIDTYRGPAFVGAPMVWSGEVPTPQTAGRFGRGVVIGVLDTGSNRTHPSFADSPACGFGPGDPKLLSARDCSRSSAGICNGPEPDDSGAGNGHGIHTASTAGGNLIGPEAVPSPLPPQPYARISGVAPCASIRSYKVCPSAVCDTAAILAAVENVLVDGDVGVVNLSVSGGMAPWSGDDRWLLNLVQAGVFVAASAGNTSPFVVDPVGRVGHRGPWVTTVASSSHDEVLAIAGRLTATAPIPPPAGTHDIALSPGVGLVGGNAPGAAAELPVRVHLANEAGCTASGGFPAGLFDGAIALMPRGGCYFEEKIANAQAAGAMLALVYNDAGGDFTMNIGAATLPAYGASRADGTALRAFVIGNGSVPTRAAFVPAYKQGDVLSRFSLRGPLAETYADLTKPDISAPGLNIYAAVHDAAGGYGITSGTSMASPHVAGAAALIRARHPAWTPLQVKSALMTTARRTGYGDDGTHPWTIDEVGSGRLQVDRAVEAGLVLDETYERFLDANPAGGSLAANELNLPSLRNTTCTQECVFVRTVRSTLSAEAYWTARLETDDPMAVTVSPTAFTLAPGGEQILTIRVRPGDHGPVLLPPAPPGFGYLVLEEAAGLAPPAHLTLAIRAERDGLFGDGFEG